jgi:hypothetical protein
MRDAGHIHTCSDAGHTGFGPAASDLAWINEPVRLGYKEGLRLVGAGKA